KTYIGGIVFNNLVQVFFIVGLKSKQAVVVVCLSECRKGSKEQQKAEHSFHTLNIHLFQLYMQVIIVPNSLAAMKPDLIVCDTQPGFQMRLNKQLADSTCCCKLLYQSFCSDGIERIKALVALRNNSCHKTVLPIGFALDCGIFFIGARAFANSIADKRRRL